MSKSPAFWVLIAAITLILLQLALGTGLVLAVFGPLLIAILIHVFLVSLFIEAAIGRAPRVLMVIPIAAYGGYYALYWSEGLEIAKRAAEIRKLNPGKVFDFDPARDALIGKELSSLVHTHKIPVVYEPQPDVKPEGHLSYRLFTMEQCRSLGHDSEHRIMTSDVKLGSRYMPVCVLRFPDSPNGRPAIVTRINRLETWERKLGIQEQITDISVDGKVIGSYRSATIQRLSVFPLALIGCTELTSKRECGVEFMRQRQVLDTVPKGVNRTKYEAPEGILLGLPRYTEQDLQNFKGFALNEPALARIEQEPKRVEDNAFATLERILDGEPVKPTWAMEYTLTRNMTRLLPYAERMVKRLGEIWDENQSQELRASAGVLAGALSGLPPAECGKVADAVFALAQRKDAPYRYPALYLRAADAGPQAFEFYKREVFTRNDLGYLRKLPALAICRIGQADAELLAELKRLYDTATNPPTQNEDKTALFVTLMKLDEESYLRQNPLASHDREWAEAVLAGKGRTETGPNNCMSKQWGSMAFLGRFMQPSLSSIGGRWDVRAAQ